MTPNTVKDWWHPRYQTVAEAFRHLFEVSEDRPAADGTRRYRLLNVPIFKTYTSRNTKCDEDYLDRMVANFYQPILATQHLANDGDADWAKDFADRYGYRPKVHLHHTSDDPQAPAPRVVGHIQDMYRAGPFLFADFAGLDEHTLHALRSQRYPDRSPEVDPKRGRLLSVALLGAEAPHFALPQMRYFGFKDHVERHGTNGMPSIIHRFKAEEFTMTPFEAVNKFRSLAADDPRRKRFETLFHNHMGEAMQQQGGMGMMGLEDVIRNVILKMKGEMFNNTPTSASGGYGMPSTPMGGMSPQQFSQTVHDILDLENNNVFHASAGHDPGEVEPGTKAESQADSPSKPMSGPKDGDSGIGERGTPSDAEPKDRGADEGDMAVPKSGLSKSGFDRAVSTVRHSMQGIKDEQLHSALDFLVGNQETVQRHLLTVLDANKKMQRVIHSLESEVATRKDNEKKHALREQLLKLRAAGYVGVGDADKIDQHVELLCKLPDDESRQQHIQLLKDVGQVHTSDRAREIHGLQGRRTFLQESVERHATQRKTDREFRRECDSMGISPAELALAEAFEKIEELQVEPVV